MAHLLGKQSCGPEILQSRHEHASEALIADAAALMTKPVQIKHVEQSCQTCYAWLKSLTRYEQKENSRTKDFFYLSIDDRVSY
jgi:hypothetical protein